MFKYNFYLLDTVVDEERCERKTLLRGKGYHLLCHTKKPKISLRLTSNDVSCVITYAWLNYIYAKSRD